MQKISAGRDFLRWERHYIATPLEWETRLLRLKRMLRGNFPVQRVTLCTPVDALNHCIFAAKL